MNVVLSSKEDVIDFLNLLQPERSERSEQTALRLPLAPMELYDLILKDGDVIAVKQHTTWMLFFGPYEGESFTGLTDYISLEGTPIVSMRAIDG